jgi:hypothetical protein
VIATLGEMDNGKWTIDNGGCAYGAIFLKTEN